MKVALTVLAPGRTGVIRGYADDDPQAQQRLMSMGLIEGATVEVVRYAPAGDPLELRVMGYALSLRKRDAADILVEPEPSP